MKYTIGVAVSVVLVLCVVANAFAADVIVFASSSSTDAVTEISEQFTAKGLGTVRLSFAASSTLARQVEAGAPAQVFLSADREWMDYLAAKGLIDLSSRRDLVGNTLVLIAPIDSPVGTVAIAKGFPLVAMLADGRLATGDPDHVPVGKYAKQALASLGIWHKVEPKLARASSTRGGLALVERGEVPFGIVFGTDAAISTKVKTVGVFPDSSHEPVVYPVALVAGNETAVARAFVDFLAGTEAGGIFRRYGFSVPTSGKSPWKP